MTKKCMDAGYPVGFIKSLISDFKKKDANKSILPEWLFEERSKILYKLPCTRKDVMLKSLLI